MPFRALRSEELMPSEFDFFPRRIAKKRTEPARTRVEDVGELQLPMEKLVLPRKAVDNFAAGVAEISLGNLSG